MQKFKRNGFVILTLLYLFLGTTSVFETGFARLIPTLVMLITGVVSFFYLSKRSWSPLCTIIIVYWAVVGISAFLIGSYETEGYVTYLRATYWCSIFFIAKELIGKGLVDNKRFDKSILIVLAVMTLAFVLNDRNYSRAEELIGNNSVYYPLLVLPWVASISKLSWKWIGIAIILLCVLVSLKRSSTLIIVGSILVVFYFDFVHGKQKRSFTKVILALAVFGAGLGIIYSNMDRVNNITQRFDSIEDDGGNGRDLIYADVIARFSQEPFEQKLFGRGYNMVRGDSNMSVPVSAHNDFLEILYDYGYIGLIVYVILHIVLIRRLFLYTKRQFIYAPGYWVSYVCFLVMSLVSHLMIYPTYVVLIASYWAFSENQYRLNQCA